MTKRICLVAASEWTLRTLMLEVVRALSSRYDVTLVSTFTDAGFWRNVVPAPECITLPIARPVAPLADLRALVGLYRLFRRERFDAVHSMNPKAGLLVALAARAARLPVRVHTFSGQVWATKTGFSRWFLVLLDRLIATLNTHIIVDGPSQLSFLREERVLGPNQGQVLGRGSMGGVNLERFKPDPATRDIVRDELDIPRTAVVVIFLGRLNPDKGVLPMAQAFAAIARRRDDVYLLIVGEDETGMLPQVRAELGPAARRLRQVTYTSEPERYLAAADLLCQPSYREGFSTIVVEAGAVGVPAVASRIYGLIDPVGEGVGGILVPPRDAAALEAAMLELIEDPDRRRRMGQSARERVARDFASGVVVKAALDFYAGVLGE